MSDSSMDAVMMRLFGNPDWHQIVDRPGTWAYMRCPHQQEEDMTQTDTTVAIPAVSAVQIVVPTPPQVVDLTEHKDLVRQYDELTSTINLAKAQQEEIKAKLKILFGDAQEARIDGVPTLTYARKTSYRTADVVREHPALVAPYRRVREVEEIDWKTLIEHHGNGVLAPYQVREFRRVSRA